MPHISARVRARPALWLAGVYLAVTLLVLVVGGPVTSVAATIHAVLLALTLWFAWRGTSDSTFGSTAEDLYPLLVMPALYAELPTLIVAGGRPMQDSTVVGWEQSLFRGQPARDLAEAHPSAALSNTLHLAYFCYYFLIFAPPIVLLLRGRRREFRQTVFALVAVFAVGFLAFIAFPVEGPRYLWPPQPAPPDQPVRALVLRILAAGSSRGTAFPSSHVGVAVVQTMYALRFQPAVGYACLALTIGIAAGAVYGGFHYGMDVVAGAAYGLIVTALVWRVPVGDRVPLAASRAAQDVEALSEARATNES